MSSSPFSLASHLIQHTQSPEEFDRATRHPFLERAGRGVLRRDILEQWLLQDAIYARAYVRFIGGLLSQLHLPTQNEGQPAPSHANSSNAAPSHESCGIHTRIFNLLISALANVKREITFFDETSRQFDLGLAELLVDTPVQGATRAYIDRFEALSVGTGETKLLQGLVTLWATEKHVDSTLASKTR